MTIWEMRYGLGVPLSYESAGRGGYPNASIFPTRYRVSPVTLPIAWVYFPCACSARTRSFPRMDVHLKQK